MFSGIMEYTYYFVDHTIMELCYTTIDLYRRLLNVIWNIWSYGIYSLNATMEFTC